MYTYVNPNELSRPKKTIERLLHQLIDTMEKQYHMHAHIIAVGSGQNNLVTADESGHFDFDYNICFSQVPQEIRSNLQGLKDRVRTAFDMLAGNEFYYGQGRTSVITFEHSEEDYSLDLGILIKNRDGQYCRLIHDKKENRFLLAEVSLLYNASSKEAYLKQHNAWGELVSLYRKNKNKHPDTDSFHIYLEALNTVYNAKGGQTTSKVSGNNHTRQQMNNHANQKNPNNSANRAAANNRSNQLNPNNSAYWKSRGVK